MSETEPSKVTIESESYSRSKAIGFNVLVTLVALADWLTVLEFDFIYQEWFLIVVAVVNAVLRVKTERPVKKQREMTDVKQFN